MAAHLVASKVSGSSTTESAHKASVALSLRAGIGRSVGALLTGCTVRVLLLALRVLVALVWALLGKLVLWCGAGVASLLLVVVSTWKLVAVQDLE
jgi:hypothetical protein